MSANAPLLSADDYLAWDRPTADHRISYGNDPEQFVDLFLPAGAGPHPIVILVHGGCWQAQFGLEPLGQIARAFADRGIAVWNIEYRRLGNGGGWPQTFLDVAAAADALRSHADRLHLDTSRVVAVGRSAGGQLAHWLGARHRLPRSSELFSSDPLHLTGAVAIAGISDMANAVRRGICQEAPQELLGGSLKSVPQNYASGSPAALMPLGIPQLHIVGCQDTVVPLDYVIEHVAFARSTGDDVELLELDRAGHFEPVTSHTHIWKQIEDAVVEMVFRSA